MGDDNDSSSHLIRWEEVIKPKHKGGLEIGNLILGNKLLIVKMAVVFHKRRRNVMA